VRSRHELSIGDASRYKGGLILLLEGPGNPFPPRQLLRLPAAPTRFEGCCGEPTGPGYEFTFRDSERNFYAFVFAENRRVANDAVAILDTLRVSLA